MIAKNRKQYVQAWRTHVHQLQAIYIDSDMPLDAWQLLESQLQEVIDMAADRCYPDPHAVASDLPPRKE